MNNRNGRREPVDVRALTIRAFCKSYSISRSRLYELIAAGTIRAVKNGHRTLIPVTEAERWFNSLPRMGGN